MNPDTERENYHSRRRSALFNHLLTVATPFAAMYLSEGGAITPELSLPVFTIIASLFFENVMRLRSEGEVVDIVKLIKIKLAEVVIGVVAGLSANPDIQAWIAYKESLNASLLATPTPEVIEQIKTYPNEQVAQVTTAIQKIANDLADIVAKGSSAESINNIVSSLLKLTGVAAGALSAVAVSVLGAVGALRVSRRVWHDFRSQYQLVSPVVVGFRRPLQPRDKSTE